MKGAAGDLVELEQIFASLTPFLIASALMLLLLFVFPGQATWLPSLM